MENQIILLLIIGIGLNIIPTNMKIFHNLLLFLPWPTQMISPLLLIPMLPHIW